MIRLVGGTDMLRRRDSERLFNEAVGAKLKARRELRGMSLEAMGAQLGINGSQVSRIESGFNPVTCVRAARMCQILGMEMKELFA